MFPALKTVLWYLSCWSLLSFSWLFLHSKLYPEFLQNQSLSSVCLCLYSFTHQVLSVRSLMQWLPFDHANYTPQVEHRKGHFCCSVFERLSHTSYPASVCHMLSQSSHIFHSFKSYNGFQSTTIKLVILFIYSFSNLYLHYFFFCLLQLRASLSPLLIRLLDLVGNHWTFIEPPLTPTLCLSTLLSNLKNTCYIQLLHCKKIHHLVLCLKNFVHFIALLKVSYVWCRFLAQNRQRMAQYLE